MNTGSKSLTRRQGEVLRYVREYREETGAMPSTREIQRHFGFSSQTAAVNHLKALEKKGFLRRLPGDLVPMSAGERVGIPLMGTIPAGMPSLDEVDTDGEVGVDLGVLGVSASARTFALKVRGDSMVGAHIQEGDTVVLEFKEPKDGDIVAALIDGETTLKRFIREGGSAYLKAENPDYPDLLPVRELVVQGVMVALIRKVGR